MPLFCPRGFRGFHQGSRQIETIDLACWIRDSIENLFDLSRLCRIDDRGERGDQASAVIHHTLGRAVTADTLCTSLRTARLTATTRGRTVAGHTLFQDARVGSTG